MRPKKCEKRGSKAGIFDKLGRFEGYFTFQSYNI